MTPATLTIQRDGTWSLVWEAQDRIVRRDYTPDTPLGTVDVDLRRFGVRAVLTVAPSAGERS